MTDEAIFDGQNEAAARSHGRPLGLPDATRRPGCHVGHQSHRAAPGGPREAAKSDMRQAIRPPGGTLRRRRRAQGVRAQALISEEMPQGSTARVLAFIVDRPHAARARHGKKELRKAFKQADSDGDGYLTVKSCGAYGWPGQSWSAGGLRRNHAPGRQEGRGDRDEPLHPAVRFFSPRGLPCETTRRGRGQKFTPRRRPRRPWRARPRAPSCMRRRRPCTSPRPPWPRPRGARPPCTSR